MNDLGNLNNRIEYLTFRFEHSVTATDIFRWLHNFERKDWYNALSVLENVVYYSGDKIYLTYQRGLKNIIEQHKGRNIKILPVSGMGKSGYAMTYSVKKISASFQKVANISMIHTDDLGSIADDDVLVLLDDFIGSGKTVAGFYDEIKGQLSGTPDIVVLCLVYMPKARGNIDKDVCVYGDEHNPAFLRRRSVWGGEMKMKKIRQFCKYSIAFLLV